jgi:hypothetical protein
MDCDDIVPTGCTAYQFAGKAVAQTLLGVRRSRKGQKRKHRQECLCYPKLP